MYVPIGDPAIRPTSGQKMRRAEKHEDTRRKLFASAVRVVGQYGYAGASVARITAEAGVAQGTFYLHFENRQALLDQLLPAVAREVVASMRQREYQQLSEEDLEIERFRVFFDVIKEMPEFLRILLEAEHFAPDSYHSQIADIVVDYARALKAASDPQDPDSYSDQELEVIVHILLGMRTYLGKQYAMPHTDEPVPEYVISAYAKLIRRGLFPKGGDSR
jgi:AcrR family transcriptional regulator